jgi:hypothetical protein
MIGDWEDLAYNQDPAYKQYNGLKAWLRSQTQDSGTTVSTTSHPLEVLRAAVQAATCEIRDNLDEQISMLVEEAGQHNIQVRQGDYYRTRCDDWDGMLPTDIDEMSVGECVALMRAAKREIAWQLNEISRLECYISVEKQMRRQGIEGRETTLRPLEREKEEQDKTPRKEETVSPTGMDSGFDMSQEAPAAGGGE